MVMVLVRDGDPMVMVSLGDGDRMVMVSAGDVYPACTGRLNGRFTVP